MHYYLKIIPIGIVSSAIFGILLKMIEKVTHKRVYTLLLNVDYFPVIKQWNFPEIIEFGFHLIVSIILVIIFYNVFKRFNIHDRILPYVLINTVIGICLYTLTLFSDRTPAFNDGIAFAYWVFGHVVFGAVVGMLIKYIVAHRHT